MANHDRDRRLNGLNPLAYLGVEPSTPPQMVQNTRRPTAQDYQNFTVGTLWLVRGTDEIWVLVNKTANVASWILTMGGNSTEFIADDGNRAIPAIGVLSVEGGPNIDTSAVPASGAHLIIGLQDDVHINGDFSVASLSGGDGGMVRCDGSGLLQSDNGTNGQLLIGGGTQPLWASLTSSDASITITPGPNSIDLIAVGGGAGGFAGLIADDANTATPNVDHKVEVVGGDGLVTVAEAGKLTINLDASTENGQLLIGGGAGVPTIWKRLESSGGTVSITYPSANTINLEALGGGGGGLLTLSGDTGTATPSVGDIKIEGGNLITTAASGSTVTISLDEPSPAANGKLLISSATGSPAWANLTAGSGIGITNSNNQITITNTLPGGGGGAAAGVTTFDCISGTASPNPATPDTIYIEGDLDPASGGYNNITTLARTVAGFNDVVEILLKPRIKLPATNSTAEQGALWINNSPVLHTFGTKNIFVGSQAGNLSLTTGSATDNVGIGQSALRALTTGAKNTCIGQGSGYYLTEGSYNTFVGEDSGRNVSTGSSNVAIGRAALYGETTGNYCIAIGDSALSANTLSGSVAIGYEAAKAGIRGVSIGYRAGLQATGSGYHTFIGYGAGDSVRGGSGHVCIGHNSDISGTATAESAGTAIAIGKNATATVTATVKNCIAIGSDSNSRGQSVVIGAGATCGTDNSAVIIGAGASGSHVSIGGGASGTGISIGIAGTPYGGVSIDGGTVAANEISIFPSASKARIGGIYSQAAQSGDLPVRVSSDGYLRYGLNAGSVYYMGIYKNDVYNVTGDMTKYYLGGTVSNQWEEVRNTGGGTLGSYGSYYEPNTAGLYHIQLTLRLNGLRPPEPQPVPPPPPPVTLDPVVIEVYNSTAYNRNYAYYPSLWYNGYQDYMSLSFSTQAYLGKDSRIRIYLQLDYRPGRISGSSIIYDKMVKCIGVDGSPFGSAEYFSYLAISLIDPS